MQTILKSILAVALLTAPAFAEETSKPKPKAGSLEDILEQAGSAAEPAPAPAPAPKPDPAARPAPTKSSRKAVPVAVRSAEPAPAAKPGPPPTDDNDSSEEAPPPEQLKAVQPTGTPRRHGPYQLGSLDCRVLDGAGIERRMPKRITGGEEPDLLCRIVVTQPADVLSEEHSLTVSVMVGGKQTHREQRKVRMSSIGRRAMVFVIPSAAIASDATAQVKLQAVLSAPATPPAGQVSQFLLEYLD